METLKQFYFIYFLQCSYSVYCIGQRQTQIVVELEAAAAFFPVSSLLLMLHNTNQEYTGG